MSNTNTENSEMTLLLSLFRHVWRNLCTSKIVVGSHVPCGVQLLWLEAEGRRGQGQVLGLSWSVDGVVLVLNGLLSEAKFT